MIAKPLAHARGSDTLPLLSRDRKGAVVVLALLALTALAQAPYHDPRRQPRTYEGGGREEAAPGDLGEIRIGYFGPADHPVWQGATLAIEEANAAGGNRGLPFKLIQGWAENPWAGGASVVVRMAYVDKVWAVIGGIDGATTHLAEQVVAKALLPLVNPVATDRSIHGANVPWMFSCVPGDHVLAPVLAGALPARYVLLSATDHDSRVFAAELRKHRAPQVKIEFESGDAAQAAARAAGSEAVAIVAEARDAAAVARALKGLKLFGDPRAAGVAGVVVPRLSTGTPEFRARFEARWQHAPDYRAAHAYDAAQLLAAAIRKAGLNRARIRDAIRELAPYQGVTGTIRWDAVGQREEAESRFGRSPG